MQHKLRRFENGRRVDALRLRELKGTGAILKVNTANSLYTIEFKKEDTVISGGIVGEEHIPVLLHGIKLHGPSLWMDCILCGGGARLEFNEFITSSITSVTIEAPRRVIRKALFNWIKEDVYIIPHG